MDEKEKTQVCLVMVSGGGFQSKWAGGQAGKELET